MTMLSKEAIKDLQKDCSFEEIQSINNGVSDINSGKIYSKQEAKLFIDNEIFSKYSINV